MIYLDQAASSFPKPSAVAEAMMEAVNEYGANPGRGTHALADRAANTIQTTRKLLAQRFGASDPRKVIFFPNATTALNQAIQGFPLMEGDHVITTMFEHNSVRRPLEYLKDQKRIEVTYLSGSSEKLIEGLYASMRPETKLVIVSHASNITGEIAPLKSMIEIIKGTASKVLVDASQTAGHFPIHMKELGIDMLAFPGHKRLLGPQGTGALLVEGEVELEPLLYGGTGSFSELPKQPDHWPEKYESGTLNTPGIAGWKAALEELNGLVSRETYLTQKLMHGLLEIKDVMVYGPGPEVERMPVVSFNIGDISSQEIAMVLDSHYQIAVRAGLHCSPTSHQYYDTTEQGAVRASIGPYNTEEEIDRFVQAIEEIRIGYMEM
ncbi:cysteine desulfurase family protein [Thalassobacillus cyri]|uniref:cysteine desulfurase n=1 Tax=Thalassobacillus cyri TaxID=571932 RepID=A0A1H3XBP6_9BACI|nr:aminotransferase class V-fold PLP-dependent enzyme [Thalassobacillus cyri]SDZ95968.1 cysteine desulfurase family protein [Thalassobacillus cyri]